MIHLFRKAPTSPRRLRKRSPGRAATSALIAAGLASGAAWISSCSWQGPRAPSVLVVAVEQLGFGAFSCGDEGGDDETGGYSAFCAEAVRFTHAYAPSTMSQASIASILTGLYPQQHGVRHNGPVGLAPALPNAAKAALARGYRTAFFSGGPPIFRRSGFNVGFETFDDGASPALRSLHRPAADVVRAFLSWRDAEASRASFFAVLYFPDLQFPDAPTVDALGTKRGLSWGSQNQEINETLGALVRELKSRGAWDESYVVLAGLNSHLEERRAGEPRPLNLRSENVRVRLMAKPARKPGRESPFNWKIDANVTLVDVGRTLFDVLGAASPCQGAAFAGSPLCEARAQGASLRSALEGPEPAWPRDRLIVTESAWARWQGLAPIRYAVRQGPYLLFSDAGARLINSYTDPLEVQAARDADPEAAEARRAAATLLSALEAEPWKGLDADAFRLVEIGSRLWGPKASATGALNRLRAATQKPPVDATLAGWRASAALAEENWNDLKAVGEKAERPEWTFVASSNMGAKASLPPDRCLAAYRAAKASPAGATELRRQCPGPEMNEFLAWSDEAALPAQRQRAQDAFFRAYAFAALDRAVAERNFQLDLAWDAHRASPGGPRAVDLVLALPENRKYRSALARKMAELASAGAGAQEPGDD